jgi:hypothetical protein
VVDTSGAILNNKGHAVYIKDTSYRKETTVGPDAKLYNNFPKVGNISGWD